VFFSSDAMEPPGAQADYTERLVLLPGIGTRYAKSLTFPDATREKFGLAQDAVLFLCPQTHYKIHPSNDALFARVLAATPGSRLVLFEGRHPRLTVTYLGRLHAALDAHGVDRNRLVILPTVPHDDYMRINSACDAVLDTVHWSGGNTSLDALSAALPVVTLPGRFMRGRQTCGMLRLMGIDDLIARDEDDYVRIAARLAGEPAWRESLSSRIRAGASAVFDDPAPIAALQEFLLASG
jgi:CRISPR-associated protein Csy1